MILQWLCTRNVIIWCYRFIQPEENGASEENKESISNEQHQLYHTTFIHDIEPVDSPDYGITQIDENPRNGAIAMKKSGLNTDPTHVAPQNDTSQLRILDENELSRKLLDIQAQVFLILLSCSRRYNKAMYDCININVHKIILDKQNCGVLKSYYITVHTSVTGVFLFHIKAVTRQISFLAKR